MKLSHAIRTPVLWVSGSSYQHTNSVATYAKKFLIVYSSKLVLLQVKVDISTKWFLYLNYVSTRRTQLKSMYFLECGNWTQWSECSATCGYGFQQRFRNCSLNGEMKVFIDRKQCYMADCPAGRWLL